MMGDFRKPKERPANAYTKCETTNAQMGFQPGQHYATRRFHPDGQSRRMMVVPSVGLEHTVRKVFPRQSAPFAVLVDMVTGEVVWRRRDALSRIHGFIHVTAEMAIAMHEQGRPR